MSVRHLCLVLGDQLDRHSDLLKQFDSKEDLLFMAEVGHESNKVWSHKVRIVFFLSAMRHFAEDMRQSKLNYLENL